VEVFENRFEHVEGLIHQRGLDVGLLKNTKTGVDVLCWLWGLFGLFNCRQGFYWLFLDFF
jgi:hypothetical protein